MSTVERVVEPWLPALLGHLAFAPGMAFPAPLRSLVALSGDRPWCTFATFVRGLFRAHHSCHPVSFARTMRRRRAPERHDGYWGLAAEARAGPIRAGLPRERDRR